MRHNITYARANYFNLFEEVLGNLNLLQLVNFKTWSRLVGLSWRSSTLDHIYVKNMKLIENISKLKPCFGDHLLVMAHLCINRPQKITYFKRDWRFYSKSKLEHELSMVNWGCGATNVQEARDDFECKLINIVDEIAPIIELNDEYFVNTPCPAIKNKLNLRGRLLKSPKRSPTLELKKRIKNLSLEIKNHFHCIKSKNIRRKILPGNTKSLWKAVNVALDNNNDSIPKCMTLDGMPIGEHERSESFATFFESKVKTITDSTMVDPSVYNGTRKLVAGCEMFMTPSEVEKCINQDNSKLCVPRF